MKQSFTLVFTHFNNHQYFHTLGKTSVETISCKSLIKAFIIRKQKIL